MSSGGRQKGLPGEKLILALDIGTADEAAKIVNLLQGRVGAFKVGLQLFTANGPSVVRIIQEKNAKVFLDLKVKVSKNWRNDDQVLKGFGYLKNPG